MSEISELRQMELDYCRDNIVYYVRKYCVYEDKDAEELIQPFDMWDMQEKALLSIHENRLNIILKARQLGFSWLVISYASNIMLTKSGRTVIGLSRTEEEAGELVRRLGVEFRNMPLIQEKGKVPYGWDGPVFEQFAMKIVIHFPDQPDSVFKAFPSSPGSVRSFTADLVIFDEWAFQQWADLIWKSAFPAINRPTGGKFIGLSTNVRGTLFESKFTDVNNKFNKIFIPWYADPRRDKQWYEDTKLNCDGDITEEYPATIDEALMSIGGAYFPEVRIETHITEEPLKGNLRKYVALDYGFDKLSVHWIQVDENYNAQIYMELDISNYNAMQAADAIFKLSKDEKIEMYLAPPDLWNRQSTTGKSTAIVFHEHGIDLVKVDNNLLQGCMRMKEWLYAPEGQKAKLTILKDCAPSLLRCLQKIQKDKLKPNIYAKTPHELTHDVDSLRYFCVYWILPAESSLKGRYRKWTQDMYEDYKNADEETKQYLIQKWGEPK